MAAFSLLVWLAIEVGHAADAPVGHVLASRYRETCAKNLDALIERELDAAEAHASSCLAEIIYDKRRAQAFTKPIVEACTDKMIAHAQGAPEESTTLAGLFVEAYGPIYRANCLDREVRDFRAGAAPSPGVRPAVLTSSSSAI